MKQNEQEKKTNFGEFDSSLKRGAISSYEVDLSRSRVAHKCLVYLLGFVNGNNSPLLQ